MARNAVRLRLVISGIIPPSDAAASRRPQSQTVPECASNAILDADLRGIPDAWSEPNDYLNTIKVRTADARMSFSRIVANGGEKVAQQAHPSSDAEWPISSECCVEPR